MSRPYIFDSARLGFRLWRDSDLAEFAAINADPEVMAHFPTALSTEETAGFITRLNAHYQEHNYSYFATELKATGELIGFVGLAFQDYVTAYSPATDIGWRLKKSAWGQGYATEGAKRCLDYAFEEAKLQRVISVCTINNLASEHVMKKIGMTQKGEFLHPKLSDYPEHERCICYEILKSTNQQFS